MPGNWPAVYTKLKDRPQLQRDVYRLALRFDDAAASDFLQAQAGARDASPGERNQALEALITRRNPELAPFLLGLVSDPATRRAAIRGLAAFDHPGTAETILGEYESFDPPARQDALQTLASRAPWARQLLDAVAASRIPRADISAYTARQIEAIGDGQLTERVREVWGDLRTTPENKVKLIARYGQELTPEAISGASRSAGRAVFQLHCAACHKLFAEGGDIGPELTGSQRNDLGYLLENIVDPSASVSSDYRMEIVETEDGRLLTGFAAAETETTLTLRAINDEIVIPKSEIKEKTSSGLSIMPDGLFDVMTRQQRCELIAYLGGSSQVPLPGGGR